jgi:hypothetical protein
VRGKRRNDRRSFPGSTFDPVNNDMKLSQANPSTSLILSPTLLRRIQYAALMMLGIGMMLTVIAASVSKDEAPIVGGWGVAFLVLAVVLVIAAIGGRLLGVRDVKNELADESSKDTPNSYNTSDTPNTLDDDDLSDRERALIKLLRNNDIPPDVVAESLREVLERRMGR